MLIVHAWLTSFFLQLYGILGGGGGGGTYLYMEGQVGMF